MSGIKEYKPSLNAAIVLYICSIFAFVLIFTVPRKYSKPIQPNNVLVGLILGIVMGGILFLNRIGVRFYIDGDKLVYTPTIFAVWFPRFEKYLLISELREIKYTRGGRYSPGRIILSPRPYEMIFPYANFKESVTNKFLLDLKEINPKITFDQRVTEILSGKK